VFEGLANYEKNPGASPTTLFGTLMMLKAACVNNPSYIDRLITPFMRVLQRMAREHITPTPPHETSPGDQIVSLCEVRGYSGMKVDCGLLYTLLWDISRTV
jgi:transformation/transcription domain-associated protein